MKASLFNVAAAILCSLGTVITTATFLFEPPSETIVSWLTMVALCIASFGGAS
jgi:hypothetical protein